jgi:hypothetical protein
MEMTKSEGKVLERSLCFALRLDPYFLDSSLLQ